MKLKIATYIEVDVPEGVDADTTYNIIRDEVKKNRSTYDFVIEEIDDDINHELIDEIVP